MQHVADRYGLALSTSRRPPRPTTGAWGPAPRPDGRAARDSESITHDPTFALGHAGLALLGHEYCASVDIDARLTAAVRYADRGTERERSHVHAVVEHVRGDSRPLIRHLREYPAMPCCCRWRCRPSPSPA